MSKDVLPVRMVVRKTSATRVGECYLLGGAGKGKYICGLRESANNNYLNIMLAMRKMIEDKEILTVEETLLTVQRMRSGAFAAVLNAD